MTLTLGRRPAPPGPVAMTLVDHLGELRRRVLVVVGALAVTMTVAFLLYGPILSFLQSPYCHVSPGHCGFYVTGPLDGLSLRVKVAAYTGVFLALPVLLWEVWRFITPGLLPKEKRYAVPFVAASMVLFGSGAAVAFLTFPHALAWLGSVGGPSLTQILDPNKYLSLILLLMVAFGVAFEFPVLLISLEVAGVVTPRQLSAWRRWAIVGIVVVAGVVTPSSDPFSMLAMAVPLYAFYELSIVAGRLLHRGTSGRTVTS